MISSISVKRPGPVMAPEILSAATYPQELMSSYDEDHKRSKRKAAQNSKVKELPCGFMFRSWSASNSNENESSSGEAELPADRPKKRTKKGTSNSNSNSNSREDDDNDGNGKKQRGRPRLDPRDETAADRAYRHRKETAIVGLRQKVANLKTTIDEMHNTFLDLHDNLVSAGVVNADSRLLARLEAAADHSDEAEGEVEEVSATSPFEYVSVRDWLDMEHNSTQFNARLPDTFMYVDHSHATLPSVPAQPMGRIEKPLSGHYTYSFQEPTFARRLHRMTLEQTYRRLAHPEFDPDQLKRTFRFTFCFSNRKRMMSRLQDILKRKSGESLENWNVPFVNIGGAGTHYPRRDSEGSAIYPPNLLPPDKAFGAKYGPQAWIEVETPRAGSTQEILEAIGFGGLWFDANDVEHYLQSKGIYLDGQSSFVEVDPSIVHLTLPQPGQGSSSWSRGSSTTGDGSPSSTRTPPGIGNGELEPANDMYMLPHFDTVSMVDHSLVGTNPTEGFDETAQDIYNKQIWPWTDASLFPFDSDYLNPNSIDVSSGASHTTRPRTLTFDVEKFILRLSEGSACLGRAPGYRREMVDNALALSLTNVL
ncbi:hypothetical protein DV735_g4079, partial [Chaetothyriales sp. CBS 134920]